MDRWDLHEAFLRTAESGSLSRAAKALEMTQPAVSKRLERLEKDLGVRLLERSPRGIRLTDAGTRYLDVVRRVRMELAETESTLSSDRASMAGLVRVSFPVALGESWLTRLALEFHALHPCLTLEIGVTDRVVDLVEDGVDLAVRVGSRLSPSLVARPLGSYGFCLVATPRYLEAHGTPKTFEALARHPYFSYGRDEERFTLPNGRTRVLEPARPVLLVNSRAILTAALQHAGIARIAEWAAWEHLERGELVRVLPELRISRSVAHAVYLQSRWVPERIRQFAAFLAERAPGIPGWQAPVSRG
ncbi:MAG: LysR family transcriptional regulator [Myxococcota bacterium]